LPSEGRFLIGVDWSHEALTRAARVPQIRECLRADIRGLPWDDHSVDGIWNLGVMEHFDEPDQRAILREFHRVLVPGGHLLLWWPPPWALDYCLLFPFGWRFPAEPGRATRTQAFQRLRESGFEHITVEFPINDVWTELVVHATAGARSARAP